MKTIYRHNLRNTHCEYVSNQFILNKGNSIDISKKTFQLCNNILGRKKIKKLQDSPPEQLTHRLFSYITLDNYRLVSNLSIFSNILECVVAKQLINYPASNNFMNSFQSSYLQGNSTELPE